MPPNKSPPPTYPQREIPQNFRRIVKISVQPGIEQSLQAYELLTRLEKDFTPYLTSRNFTIQSLNEMCCCGRGKMGKNHSILGYCMPAGDKQHSRGIYIRLRYPQSHGFMDYECLFGTMCHEVTHIIHGAHSAEFYEEMERIREGVEKMMGSKDYMVFGGAGVSLGGWRPTGDVKKGAANAAEGRRQINTIMGGGATGTTNNSRSKMSKKDRICSAAERRIQDEVICGECIEIDEDDENGVEIIEEGSLDDSVVEVVENPVKEIKKDVIDLTADSPDVKKTGSLPEKAKRVTKEKKTTKTTTTTTTTSNKSHKQWSCSSCTLLNRSQILFCSACNTPSPSIESASISKAQEILNKDKVDDFKEREKKRSVEEFGFDIYGSKSKSTRLSDHLT